MARGQLGDSSGRADVNRAVALNSQLAAWRDSLTQAETASGGGGLMRVVRISRAIPKAIHTTLANRPPTPAQAIRRAAEVWRSSDDPFMTPAIMPKAEQLPACVTLELCEYGGHVGFVGAGPGLAPRWWLEERIPEFLLARIPDFDAPSGYRPAVYMNGAPHGDFSVLATIPAALVQSVVKETIVVDDQ